MEKPKGAALNSCSCLCSGSRLGRDGTLTSFGKVLNQMLATFPIEDSVSEAKKGMRTLRSLLVKFHSNTQEQYGQRTYAAGLSTKSIVSREYSLKV